MAYIDVKQLCDEVSVLVKGVTGETIEYGETWPSALTKIKTALERLTDKEPNLSDAEWEEIKE